MDLQTQMRLQNIFGSTPSMNLPTSGPAALSTPPLQNPGQDPYSNISFGSTNFQMPPTDASGTPTSGAGAPTFADPAEKGFDAIQKMQQMYQPQTTATDRFNELMQQYPKREDYRPGGWRKVAAALAMFGRGGPQLAQQVVDKPFQDALSDWSNQVKPAAEAANFERYQNSNSRMMAFQTVAQELRQQAIDNKDKIDQGKLEVMQHRASIYQFKAMHPNLELIYPKGGNVSYLDPSTKQMVDTGIPVGSMTDLDKINLNEKNTLTNIGAKGAIAEKIEGMKENTKGWSIVDIPDKDNPGQKISVRMNMDTGAVAPIIYEGKNVSATKLGTSKSAYDELTNQTKAMMEGAKMLLPHVNDLRTQALNLEKNGLFGPVMSRIRNLAAKVGTTGTPEQIQASLDDFARAITNDPQLSQDAAVGQFVTSLGLMASGMGRVHGGARGGGSIQMINYLKNLLSADSTLAMFNGRLNSIDSYLKGYAAGPQSPANDKLGSALDKLFPK